MNGWSKWVGLAVVVLVLVGVGYAVKMQKQPEGFSVVYLQTGELYVGKLTLFPKMKIDAAYAVVTIRDPKDAAKNNFQLNPLNEMVWAPKTLYLNRDNVVFYGPLDENSNAAKGLSEKGIK